MATTNDRILMSERNDRVRGTVRIWKENRRSYRFVVERSDIDGVYDRIEGFSTFKQAREEAKCYWG